VAGGAGGKRSNFQNVKEFQTDFHKKDGKLTVFSLFYLAKNLSFTFLKGLPSVLSIKTNTDLPPRRLNG
jgi:hypothetical protein